MRQQTLKYQKHSETSREAARSMFEPSGAMRKRVLAFIRDKGPCTDEEIIDGTGLNPSTARPRRIELLTAGFIKQDGTLKTRSGRRAAAWVGVGR